MGTYLNKGYDFNNGEQVTADKLDNLVELATFGSGAVDSSSTILSGGAIIVRDSGITASKIATNAVTTVKILDANVTTAKIADLNVTSGKIADLGVTTAKIADLNVTTGKIADLGVTTGKIADAAVTAAKLAEPLTIGTAQNSTSGTAIDFNSIPSWVKRVTVILSGVSTNGTNDLEVLLGTGTSGSPAFVSTGYSGGGVRTSATGVGGYTWTTGFAILANNASTAISGNMILTKITGNTWVASSAFGGSAGDFFFGSGGNVALSSTLTQIRIKTTSTNTFDAGQINIMYE